MKNQKYNALLRILHWAMGVTIIGLLTLGIYMADLDKEDPSRMDLYNLHKSFGALILILVFVRIAVRIFTKTPELPKGLSAFVKKAAKLAHYALYFFMFFIPLSGYIMSNSYGYPVAIFGFELPKLFADNKETGGLAGEAHELLAYALIALLILHVAGALKHRFFDKKENDVLGRMI